MNRAIFSRQRMLDGGRERKNQATKENESHRRERGWPSRMRVEEEDRVTTSVKRNDTIAAPPPLSLPPYLSLSLPSSFPLERTTMILDVADRASERLALLSSHSHGSSSTA